MRWNSRIIFPVTWLLVAPVATYGTIMLLTDGLHLLLRNQWVPLIFVVPTLLTTLVGCLTGRRPYAIVLGSVGSVLVTVASMFVLFLIAISQNPDVFQ